MGGSLIVISSGDHQSNNNSDQYQQTFYVAETGLIEGEKWILDNYLGHWMNSIPSDKDVLGEIPDSPGPLSDYNVKKEIWDDKKTEYDEAKEGGYFRHTFGRGPAVNDTTVNRTDSKCLSSFKNLDTDDKGDVKIVGKGKLPIQKSFLEIEKESKEHFATAIFDIDHFKNVNDTYGHAAGDEIIKKVSSIATSVISAPDIFGRIGGEEFLAVIFNNSKEHLQQICEKVRSTVENDETLFDNQKIRVTISGGVCFTDESTSVSDMVNKADERLYLAKKNGRNKFYLNEGE